jgi:AcrR family transcriptional regulator
MGSGFPAAGSAGGNGRRTRSADRVAATIDEQTERVLAKVDAKTERALAKVDAKTTRAASKVDATTAQAVAKVDEKTARMANKVGEKAAKLAQHAARGAAALDRVAAHLEAVDLWTRTEPGARKPRFGRTEIAAAAIRVADAEGLDALSMRRLATDLDVGTMTLYHYVRTKDELLSLIRDAVMAEVVLPPDEVLPADWKEAMVVIATRTRDVMLRHPWVTSIDEGPSIGPSSVRHFDQSLQALAGLDRPFDVKLDILTTVDEYVFGYCRNVVVEEAVWDELPGLSEYVTRLLADGTHPQLQAVVDELGIDGVWAEVERLSADAARFLRNVRRLLDGIERSL